MDTPDNATSSTTRTAIGIWVARLVAAMPVALLLVVPEAVMAALVVMLAGVVVLAVGSLGAAIAVRDRLHLLLRTLARLPRP